MNAAHVALFVYELLNPSFIAVAAAVSGFTIAAVLVTMILEVIPQERR